MNSQKLNHPFKKRVKMFHLKKSASSSNIFSTINYYEPEKNLYFNKSQKIHLNNSSIISSRFITIKNKFKINHNNLDPHLLLEDITKFKNIINKLNIELLNVKGENRKKAEEIKKVQKVLENSKNKLKEKNYIQKLNEQNQMIKLKEIYLMLQGKIKEIADENKTILNKIKKIDLEDLTKENENEINIIKEKVKEYNDNIIKNKNLEKKLNLCHFYKEQYFQNHKYVISIINEINTKTNTINLLKENLQKLKDKYLQINENKRRFISYNDSVKKSNEKLLLDKKKREDFLKKKPIILEKIEAFKNKTKDLINDEKEKKEEINYIQKNKNKKEEPKNTFYKIVIKKNPDDNINQKIKLFESLIKESKERQKEFIDLFEYYNDYIQQKYNYDKIQKEVKLIENKNRKNSEKSEKSEFINSTSNSINIKNDINIGNQKNKQKEFDTFKFLLSILLDIKNVSKEKFENILLNFRTQNYYLGNLNDKNNYLLKLSKEILNLIKDKNENDINILKDLFIYLFEEKYKGNKESFLNNVINDFADKKELTNIINEENKLYEKIRQLYFSNANSIKEKIKKNNSKLISYKEIKNIFKEEKLYVYNNEEKVYLFKFFIYLLKKHSTSFNENDSIADFQSDDIIKFFNDELIINKENNNKNLNDEEITLTSDKLKDIVNSFILRFKKFLEEKKLTVKKFLGDSEMSFVNIFTFFDLLQQNQIDMDKITLSCILEKYKKDEGSEDINVNLFENDLIK